MIADLLETGKDGSSNQWFEISRVKLQSYTDTSPRPGTWPKFEETGKSILC